MGNPRVLSIFMVSWLWGSGLRRREKEKDFQSVCICLQNTQVRVADSGTRKADLEGIHDR
jgi:hypothetical protein